MANDKHIFIGIGGQGVKTVAKIKAKVYEKRYPSRTAARSRRQQMDEDYRFIFLDTDQRDIDKANRENRKSFEQGNYPFINPQTDLVNLGRANPKAIYYEAQQQPDLLMSKRILEACSPQLASQIPDQPLSFGAGAFRIKSRIAFAHSLADFQQKMHAAISALNDIRVVGGEDSKIYYWLVSSCLGGTGSGIYNDVLYQINQIHHQIVGNGDPQLVYILYMPKLFIDANSTEEKYSLNAFSVFSELESFMAMAFDEEKNTLMHRLAFANEYSLINTERAYRPFLYMIPVDIQTDKNTSLGSADTMIHNTAEMLYHLHYGEGGDTFRSDNDNYIHDKLKDNPDKFLIPMGYISLQKPIAQFNKYMRARFERDLLRSWLLRDSKEETAVTKDDVKRVEKRFSKQLNLGENSTIASKLYNRHISEIDELVDGIDVSKPDLNPEATYNNIETTLDEIKDCYKREGEGTKKAATKKLILKEIWEEAENLIREHGIAYTIKVIGDVHDNMHKELETPSTNDEEISSDRLRELSDKAEDNNWMEKYFPLTPDNTKDIKAYKDKLQTYVNKKIENITNEWADKIKRDFCGNKKTDELSKLKSYLSRIKDRAGEMATEASKYYSDLAIDLGETVKDVTSVYLPMLKNICDSNGWVAGNFFAKNYNKIIESDQNAEETPKYDDLKEFINSHIYDAAKEGVKIPQDYLLTIEEEDAARSGETTKKVTDVRFFANPKVEERATKDPEKIIKDFVDAAVREFEKDLQNKTQDNWGNRKISDFFHDLTDDDKDLVRKQLSPALFFSYNNNRPELTKIEEHKVFVAGSEELAEEMLGYQKGNQKHRFEKTNDLNMALVIRYKLGMSLKDYRIYDNIKSVYDKASFRERYHFHKLYADHLDNLSLANLPLEILPYHRTFVKMRLLEAMAKDLAPFMHTDEYDDGAYTNTIFSHETDKLFRIALPEAFETDMEVTGGKIGIQKESEGRNYYTEIEADSFPAAFKKYEKLFNNLHFEETTEKFIHALMGARAHDGKKKSIKGTEVLKAKFADARKELMEEFNEKRNRSSNGEERRIYATLFDVLKKELKIFSDFTK